MFGQSSSDRPPEADNRSFIILFEVEQLLFVEDICWQEPRDDSLRD